MCGSCCSGASCLACKIIGGLVLIVVALLAVAALLGVYATHMVPGGGMAFGSAEGSLAILAGVVAIKVAYKTGKKLCPCTRKGCGSGGDCCGGSDCGSQGK